MVFIGLGSNLPGPWGTPAATVLRALNEIEMNGLHVKQVSSFYSSKAYGREGVPDYVNSVVRVSTFFPPLALLARLHRIEKMAARSRGQRWGARTLDLDLLDWKGCITGPREEKGSGQAAFRPLSLPHPGIVVRPFVLIPLAEIAPEWHHPISGKTARTLAKGIQMQKAGRILAIQPS
jgi:2-amino-4-hydroxy-6-hydroxymethyldihydropteridine diphosphokinase